MEQIETIKELINQGYVDKAIEALDALLAQPDFAGKDEAYYLRGNAYRKQGNWQQTLNNYQSAIEINPESPALQARQMVMDILEFYHKDMYNQ
jgi:tetratricopeptide (TPR) repeat protein